jgi:putative ABC transport system permease protein
MNLRDLKLRARALFIPGRVERELDDELSFHVERETQKLVAEGLTRADARAKALARFGSVPSFDRSVLGSEQVQRKGSEVVQKIVQGSEISTRFNVQRSRVGLNPLNSF